MLSLLISPLGKILLSLGAVLAVFGFGYYKGYENLTEYKTQMKAQIQAQQLVNEQIIKRQDIITKGISNEYQAKIARLESVYKRVQHNSTSKLSSNADTTTRIDEKAENLVLDCAVTTQQLMSLQDWIKAQQQK